METITTNQLQEITGVPYKTLDRWASYLSPTLNDLGTGASRQWSKMDVIAVAYAEQMRRGGFGHEAVVEVLQVVSKMEPKEFVANLRKGKTLLHLKCMGPKKGDEAWQEAQEWYKSPDYDPWFRPSKGGMTVNHAIVFNHWDVRNAYEKVRPEFDRLEAEAAALNGQGR